MTPAHFVFRLTCLLLVNMAQANQHVPSGVRQKSGLMSVKAGDTLTLECFYDADLAAKFYWYKLILGRKPQLISTVFKYETNGTFYNEFKNNPRFSLDSEPEFGDGTTVVVEGPGSNIQTLVGQSESETVQPGGSVTLTCTVQIGSCDGEHSVYWFRNSEESFAGHLYSHRGRNDHCGKRSQEQTLTCLYNLPLKNLNVSHAGTYYCAVASCGYIVFGNGTKLGFQDEVTSVYLLRGALAFTSFLSFLQAFLLFRVYKKKSPNNSGSRSRFPHSCTTTTEGEQDEENRQYAGLRLQKVYTSTRQRTETTDCVYSSVKN